jgi:hypothetical protein
MCEHVERQALQRLGHPSQILLDPAHRAMLIHAQIDPISVPGLDQPDGTTLTGAPTIVL